ncbi:MAG TPA: TIGR03435 family protein [Bryobacteraceae bacterium]|jgi:uncharacterized protein (TIGR03435 family)|nr:TIGR03435 family protein [Bryobacteraceae bacterium]
MLRHAFAALVLSAAAAAQAPEKKVVFEAAAIKAPDPNYSGSGWHSSKLELKIENMNLRQLIMVAYDVKQYQVAGGPKWLDGDRWSIVAKLPDDTQVDQDDTAMRLAMQSLLAERYQLALHKESREMSAYALLVSKSGPKLARSDYNGSSSKGGRGKLTCRGISMDRLASLLSSRFDLPVVDQTALPGKFDFTLEWSPDETGDSGGPTIFTALQEQLGLKLESRHVPVEILVIDRAEKPGEN